jgi:hypothetical protein
MVLHLSFLMYFSNLATECNSAEFLRVSVDLSTCSVSCLVTPYMVLAYHS